MLSGWGLVICDLKGWFGEQGTDLEYGVRIVIEKVHGVSQTLQVPWIPS